MVEKIKIPRFSAEEINNLAEGMAEMISQQSKARRVFQRNRVKSSVTNLN